MEPILIRHQLRTRTVPGLDTTIALRLHSMETLLCVLIRLAVTDSPRATRRAMGAFQRILDTMAIFNHTAAPIPMSNTSGRSGVDGWPA